MQRQSSSTILVLLFRRCLWHPSRVRLAAKSMASSLTAWLQSSRLSYAFFPVFSSQIGLASKTHSCFRLPSDFHPFSSRTSSEPLTLTLAKRGTSREVEVASSPDLHFEAPLKIVEYPDPILRARNKRITKFDENLKMLVKEMFDVMYKTDGIGLSAPQVGLNVRLLVFNPAGERGVGEELVLVNPKVQKYSKKIVLFNEGCLSFPGIYADVERPESVKVDAQDITGARFTVNFSGLPARVFQHEFDHLLGVLFFDRMTDEVLDSIRSELQALEKKYETLTGLPNPEKVENTSRRKEAAGFGRS